MKYIKFIIFSSLYTKLIFGQLNKPFRDNDPRSLIDTEDKALNNFIHSSDSISDIPLSEYELNKLTNSLNDSSSNSLRKYKDPDYLNKFSSNSVQENEGALSPDKFDIEEPNTSKILVQQPKRHNVLDILQDRFFDQGVMNILEKSMNTIATRALHAINTLDPYVIQKCEKWIYKCILSKKCTPFEECVATIWGTEFLTKSTGLFTQLHLEDLFESMARILHTKTEIAVGKTIIDYCPNSKKLFKKVFKMMGIHPKIRPLHENSNNFVCSLISNQLKPYRDQKFIYDLKKCDYSDMIEHCRKKMIPIDFQRFFLFYHNINSKNSSIMEIPFLKDTLPINAALEDCYHDSQVANTHCMASIVLTETCQRECEMSRCVLSYIKKKRCNIGTDLDFMNSSMTQCQSVTHDLKLSTKVQCKFSSNFSESLLTVSWKMFLLLIFSIFFII